MSELNWEIFGNLPGAENENFEAVCRMLIRRHYGRYGIFFSLANQPGVEFHLQLNSDCILGEEGRWFGWQCRYYDLQRARNIGSTRRKKIEKAIRTTEKKLPGITDWILWTKYPLTKADQRWFYGIDSKMQLQLWNEDELEEHLQGPGDIVRGTYFGELIITPETLSDLHKINTNPIQKRWQPELHQVVKPERLIRKSLVESRSWEDLPNLIKNLKDGVSLMESELKNFPENLASNIDDAISIIGILSEKTETIYQNLISGNIELVQQLLPDTKAKLSKAIASIPRKLRNLNNPFALQITNVFAARRRTYASLDNLSKVLNLHFIAVIAKAGYGKTQLAAQITIGQENRLYGIFLRGRELKSSQNLNNFIAGQVIINGNPVPSMEALIAAVNAAGQRAKCRIPIVIDGLNESEDPRDWKGNLSSLQQLLDDYPNVLLICTLRPDFIYDALPEDTFQIEIKGFDTDIREAVKKYFSHYKISISGRFFIPELFNHPLSLKIFCEVTNPKADKDIEIDILPESLTGLFIQYLNQATTRIQELAPRSHRIYEQDVRKAYAEIGIMLWEERSRSINERKLRERLNDAGRPWNQSLIMALEQEGVILRTKDLDKEEYSIAATYDALAGHLVADSILRQQGFNNFETWIKASENINLLVGEYSDLHPLYQDILDAMVGLTPRVFHRKQFWQLVEEPLRSTALNKTADLESAFLDNETTNELAKLIAKQNEKPPHNLLNRLWNTRSGINHPLNAEFLDDILQSLEMSNRDVLWSEWVRSRNEDILEELQYLEKKWCGCIERTANDTLDALWIMWLLTSTVRKLRDQATKTLYWFGRYSQLNFLELTLGALEINDPYVSERMLAALYGIVMACQHDISEGGFVEVVLPSIGRKLYNAMFSLTSEYATTHILSRDYSRRAIEISLIHYPDFLTQEEKNRINPPYSDGGIREWGESEDENKNQYSEGTGPIHMDFGNYSLGRLVNDRGNYDYDHPEYKKVKANIFWRIYNLGYSLDKFGEIDKAIMQNRYRFGRRTNGGKIDRYGKKYSWIAFFELAGYRNDLGLLNKYYGDEGRIPDIDIDPSFPEKTKEIDFIREEFLGDSEINVNEWITHGGLPEISPYLLVSDFNEHEDEGPWVLLSGYVNQENEDLNRSRFIVMRSLIIDSSDEKKFIELLKHQDSNRFRSPSIPEDYYTFAGEIPWCETYPYNSTTEMSFEIDNKTRKVPIKKFVILKEGNPLSSKNQDELLDEIEQSIRMQIDLSERERGKKLLDNIEERGFTCEVKEVEVERKISIIETVKIHVPIRENNWEEYHSNIIPGRNIATPSKEICEYFNLSSRPQTFDLFDTEGNRASITFRFGEKWRSSQNFVFFRKDLLDRYFQETASALVWLIWGERQYHHSEISKFRAYADNNKSYARYQNVISYVQLI